MSKIARIYQGLEEIQKYYQGGVLQRLFFDWKHYIGNELNIEYAKECAGRNVVISGKTYQNLLKPINSTNWSGESCEITDNYIKLIQSGYTEDIRTSCDLLKSGTKYTLVYNVKNHTLSSKAFVLKGGMEGKFIVNNNITLPIAIGLNRFTFTTSPTKANVSLFSLGISSGSLDGEYIELSDIILLEGDYTNIDLPNSINGIESVSEKENNILSVKINDNTTTLNLPIPLRSLPNGVCDTIEGNKLVQRVEKVTFDGTKKINLYNASTYARFSINMPINAKAYSKRTAVYAKGYYFDAIMNKDRVIFSSAVEGANRLYIYNYDYKTVNDFKAYLTENPLEVYYELATPTETEITPDMILINGEPITDTVGIELPNGIKDIMEKGIYTKNINKIVLDGSDDELWVETIWSVEWGKTHNGAKVFEYRNLRGTSYMASNNQNNFLYESTDTTLSPYYGTNLKELPENAFICKGAYIDFGCHFNTVEDFRNFLAENPFTIQYELMNPIKIPLFSIKEGLTILKSTNNINPEIELDCLVRDDFQNMCDNEWERGNIDLNTGVNKDSTNRIRLVNDIQVKSNTTYRIDITNLVLGKNIGLRCYDISKTYISGGLIGDIKSSTYPFTTPEDCYYIRFIVETNDTNFKIYLKEVIN